jgi:ribosomal protein L37AE/L43A
MTSTKDSPDKCPECQSKEISGIYSRDRDMTVAWACMSCGHAWLRFSREDGHALGLNTYADAAIAAWDKGISGK